MSFRNKRPSKPFVSPFSHPSKIPKPTVTTTTAPPPPSQPPSQSVTTSIDQLVSILADAGCTLINTSGPPCLPADVHKLRHRLQSRFLLDPVLRSKFLAGFGAYIDSRNDLRRVLLPSNRDNSGNGRSESLARVLLLVPSIQLDLQNMLIEKLPEYFDNDNCGHSSSSTSRLDEDIARLILNQFRWLDFLVDCEAFTENLFQVLSICPPHLKKEIIGSLPEVMGDTNNKTVVDSLEKVLQDDSTAAVAVIDCFSSLNLDDMLQDKVTTIALSCIRTIEAEKLPYLLRFLLLSATPANARRIITQFREQYKLVGVFDTRSTQHNKLKGKSVVDNAEASVLDALGSSFRFKNILCQEILSELQYVDKPQDHKVIDVWLLMLIYKNCESMQKSVEKVLKKKIIEGSILDVLFEQCLLGNKELVKDHFCSFLQFAEYLLACKEQKVSKFGIQMYKYLFEGFPDTYSRQEVLGSLVTHVGSGITYEVSSALDAMVMLASKYSQELIPICSYITGILDYMEGFSTENLHKVYDVFCLLSRSARSNTDSFGSSIAAELFMIVRKQVSNPEFKYKKMGLIGTLKILSHFGNTDEVSCSSSSQKLNYEEALELLRTSLDSCQQLPISLILFYDELSAILDSKPLHPAIMERVGQLVGEFESMFLSDLESGKLPVSDLYCGLEGELWMNLDGDISPICMNILPLASSSSRSTSLQTLPANFRLLSVMERLGNQGSLGGIDALLGCPIHLPSSKFITESWQSLNKKQKHVVCLSLYYAINWIRELLNAFGTQVAGRFDCISQATKEDMVTKISKRLKNLVFLESLLNNILKECPLSLPELSSASSPGQPTRIEKNTEQMRANQDSSQINRKNNKKSTKPSKNSGTQGNNTTQLTIIETWKKAGAISSDVANESSTGPSSKVSQPEAATCSTTNSNGSIDTDIEISEIAKLLEAQRYRFRPLLVDCFSILSYSKDNDSCCADPTCELPVYLYLLRDLNSKLEYFSPKPTSFRSLSTPLGLSGITTVEFVNKIQTLFVTLRRHLDSAISLLEHGSESCQTHWSDQSSMAGNPEITNVVLSVPSVSSLVVKETLFCFSKMLTCPDLILSKQSSLLDLLKSFQLKKVNDIGGIQSLSSTGDVFCLYGGVFEFLESVLDTALCFSFMLASEVVVTLESVVISLQKVIDKPLEGTTKHKTAVAQELLVTSRNKLCSSAHKVLSHDWHDIENGWKGKGEMVQKIVHIYLENCESTSQSLDELACSILPTVSLSSRTTAEDYSHGFTTLCSSTFSVWYKELHEQNLVILGKLVKEAVQINKSRATPQPAAVQILMEKLHRSVNVVVCLINICKTHDKVTVRTMTVKYGGKYVDSFLKVFEFLDSKFQDHKQLIIQLFKDFQFGTRTLQTLCSEAKGLKQTSITSRIPATKRSLERFLFRVKALLHTSSSGCTFSMGNLKHKNLIGQVVSSQAYIDGENENNSDDFVGSVAEDEVVGNSEDEMNL
ncbi:putative fanconi anaemia protein FANCD2 [Helianthus annuus]|uniref:Fanconi anaemia protein FANCD2 n=1 Tax=Helianthus annuus TaxID=4232 RepID=A0A251TQR5_HELAN|nr:Fanconi anemia group D2 protein isoform X1 [Helianthus annuus]KAF5798258.1 putative fanconi anaemia protein FANCD2 [Helianthus annuus]KAJ0549882.1 putative fanconi anemia protein FANCD2 [Helianthus annuus]KAJ0556420.1 putative fanconi anemia protein FANCD2 [Helianthus annuus]KAJ0562841.1 putative fanconi anemia protein FANCD2 [Helianthus annuus]KAJ0904381.1 putative fanconi anaemia protein FANCD2 [Helianthus annuus]